MRSLVFRLLALTIILLPFHSSLLAYELKSSPVASWQAGVTSDPEYYKLPSEVGLSDAEVQQMKQLVRDAVKQFNKSKRFGRILPFKNYGIQYRASLNAEGEKEIWINGFCKEYVQPGDFTTYEVFVFDGGSCFFKTILNLKKNTASGVGINGSA